MEVEDYVLVGVVMRVSVIVGLFLGDGFGLLLLLFLWPGWGVYISWLSMVGHGRIVVNEIKKLILLCCVVAVVPL